MADELVQSRSRRGWAVVAALFTSVMLTVVLAAQDQPPPDKPVVIDKTKESPLRRLNYTRGMRKNNLQTMISDPGVLASATKQVEALDQARASHLKLFQDNLEALRPSLFSAFCPQTLPQPYQALSYLLHDAGGRRDVPPITLLVNRSLQRQTWLEDELLRSIYERWELGQLEERSTLLGISGAILDPAAAVSGNWGDGLLASGFDDVKQKYPRAPEVSAKYLGTMLWMAELANEAPPEGLGVCGSNNAAEAPAKAVPGAPAAPPPPTP